MAVSNTYPTYDPNLLLAFHELEEKAYRDVIHFFEAHQEVFYLLDVPDYLSCKFRYTQALFELGRYYSYLEVVDEMLEEVIYHTITRLDEEEDVFQSLLFYKAACYYHLMEYKQAITILTEMLKINPMHKSAAFLYRKCKVKCSPLFVDRLKQYGVLGIMLAAISISIDLLVIQAFYPNYDFVIKACRNILLFTSLTSIITAELGFRVFIYARLQQRLQQYQQKQS